MVSRVAPWFPRCVLPLFLWLTLTPLRHATAQTVDEATLWAQKEPMALLTLMQQRCRETDPVRAIVGCNALADAMNGSVDVTPEAAAGVNCRLRDLFMQRVQLKNAEEPARECLRYIESWKGAISSEFIAELVALAEILHQSGRYADAEPLFRRALDIAESVRGKRHPDVATILGEYASILLARGNLAEAERLFRRALDIAESVQDKRHPDVAHSLNRLGELLVARGMLSKAERLFRRALDIAEAALGKQHPDVATSLSNLASLFQLRGDFSTAELLFKRALAIREAALGPQHPNVAVSLYNLAGLLQDRGQLKEAEPLYQRGLESMEAALGPAHPMVATFLHGTALFLHTRGKLAEAESLFRRALDIRKAKLGLQHPDVAASSNKLARLLMDRGKSMEAEPLLRQALDIRKAALGNQHRDVAATIADLASLLYSRGKLSEAEPLARSALNIRKATLSPQHPDIASSQQLLALCFEASGEFSKAESLFRSSLKSLKTVLGPQHSDVADALYNLALLLQASNKLPEAEDLHRRALKIRETVLGLLHPKVALSLTSSADLALSQNQWPAALGFLSRAGAIWESMLRTSPSEDYAQTLLKSWQLEQMRVFGVPLLLRGDGDALDLALRTALLNKSRTQDVGTLVNQALRSRLETDEQKAKFARMQQLLTDRAQLLDRLGGREKRAQEQQLLWEAQRLNQELSQQLGVSSSQSIFTVAEIRKAVAAKLAADAALVEVVIGQTRDYQAPTLAKQQASIEYHYIALVLYLGGQAEAVDLGKVDQVHKAVVPLLKGLRDPWAVVQGKAHDAYQAVFAKLDDTLKRRGIRQLIVSPEMVLQLLPWQALYDGKQYLVDRYAIRYVAAGRDLLRPVAAGSPQQAVVLANPEVSNPRVFQAEATAQTIAQQMRARFYAGRDATEQNLLRAVSPFTLLLATHGEYEAPPMAVAARPASPPQSQLAYASTRRPLDSGLVMLGVPRPLNPDGPQLPDLSNIEEAMHRSQLLLQPGADPLQANQNGKLTAEEALSLPLSGTQLVTTLACEGGLGALGIGQGVYGLRRAFLQAGAETVVSTLWKVEENSASELIRRYYDKLLKGKGRVEALDEAMKELRSDKDHPEYSHPYYWAPFVVLGMDGPLRPPATL